MFHDLTSVTQSGLAKKLHVSIVVNITHQCIQIALLFQPLCSHCYTNSTMLRNLLMHVALKTHSARKSKGLRAGTRLG